MVAPVTKPTAALGGRPSRSSSQALATSSMAECAGVTRRRPAFWSQALTSQSAASAAGYVQPQRWAAVPAVAMGATGTALLIFTPGNETLTSLNWVWPPLLVALAVWMLVQVRRSVTGKARWVLTPVVAVLALASIGATYDNIARTGDQATVAAPGKLYDVGGHRLHLDCHGHGVPQSFSPTVSAGSPRAGRGSPAPSRRPPASAPTTVPDRAGARKLRAPGTASSRPRTCTRSSPRPASTAPTCWSGTPPAGLTR